MFESKWAVPAAGFRWADRQLFGMTKRGKAGGRFLVPVASPDLPHIYDVFGQTALFRTFVAVEPTEPGILQFANRYGLLGGPYSVQISEPDPVRPGRFWPGCGESMSAWVREIGLMRHIVVDLLDNCRNGNARKLRKFIRWERTKEGHRVLYSGPPIPGWDRPSRVIGSYANESLPAVRTGDTLRPAWLALIDIVNAQLERFPIHALLTDKSSAKDSAAALTLPTGSLIAALWFQLARTIADNPQIQRCAECGEYFDTSAGTPARKKRADSVYHSPACRLRAYRKRRKEQSAGPAKTKSSPRRKAR